MSMEQTLQTIKDFMDMDTLATKIEIALKELNPNGYVRAYFSNAICDSIRIRYSKSPQKEWYNGIYENSQFCTAHVWNVTATGKILQRGTTGHYGFEYNSGPLRPRNKKVCLTEAELIHHIVGQFKKFTTF